MKWLKFFIALVVPFFMSCQTASVPKTAAESQGEAISAIHSVAEALSTTGTVSVKYCPVDGKHYAPHLKICPEHNILLKETEE